MQSIEWKVGGNSRTIFNPEFPTQQIQAELVTPDASQLGKKHVLMAGEYGNGTPAFRQFTLTGPDGHVVFSRMGKTLTAYLVIGPTVYRRTFFGSSIVAYGLDPSSGYTLTVTPTEADNEMPMTFYVDSNNAG